MNKKTIIRAAVALAVSFALNVHAADPLPRGEPQALGFSPAGLSRIDRFFEAEIGADRIPGAVVAIARDGKLAYYKAIGFRDKATRAPMTTDAIFNLASMTKVMAVVTALTLYEEGQLPLKQPLSNWYPQFARMQVGVVDASGAVKAEPARNPITIQDLMRHSSGITYGARGNTAVHKLWPGSSSGAAFQYGGTEFLDHIAKLPLLYQPGTTWDYGLSHDVLGLVVEKITGKTLGATMQERLWSKVRMPDTSFAVPADKRARLAQPLPLDPVTGNKQDIRILREFPKFDCAGSCAFSTAGDYLRFGQMLLNGGELDGQRVLSPKTVRFMTSDHLGKDVRNNVAGTEAGRAGYGFGLGVAVRTEPGIAATNGTVGDYSWNGANGTVFWVDPRERLTVVMMSVGPGEIRKYFREQMAALVYGAMER